MADVRITLAGLWIALMLTYLLGDVLRIFAGDVTPGEIDGQPANEAMWPAAAGAMLVPIVMIVLSLSLAHPAVRWVGLVASAGLVIFNLFGLPYPGVYDTVLIVVGFVVNGLVIWNSWTWASRARSPTEGRAPHRWPMAAPEGRQPPSNRRG